MFVDFCFILVSRMAHSTANRGLRQFRVEPIVKKATQAIIVHRRIWKQIASATWMGQKHDALFSISILDTPFQLQIVL